MALPLSPLEFVSSWVRSMPSKPALSPFATSQYVRSLSRMKLESGVNVMVEKLVVIMSAVENVSTELLGSPKALL